MILGIVYFFIGHLYSWDTGKNLKWKQRSFHLFRIHFFLYERQIKVSLKLSWRILWYTFICIRDRVLLYSQLLQKQFTPGWCKNLIQLLKRLKGKNVICESCTLPSSYFASILILKYFANNTALIRYSQW